MPGEALFLPSGLSRAILPVHARIAAGIEPPPRPVRPAAVAVGLVRPVAPMSEPEAALPEAPPPEPAPPPLERNRLDRRVMLAWWISGLLSSAILIALGAGVLLSVRAELVERKLWQPVLWLALGLAAMKVVWTIVSPPLAWHRWRWGMDDELLVLRWGILWHHERAIPISRLQHVDLSRGPIERLLGLTTLIVHTAGTTSASFDLPGLADAQARSLRDRILAARGDDVV